MADPETLAWLPGLVTVTVLVMVQLNEALPVEPALSVAVTVGVYEPAVVGVPVMAPVEELIESPVGSPVADHEVMVATDDESVAESDRPLMAEPDRSDWLPGLVTVTVLVITQVKETWPEKPLLSVTVTTTASEPPVVGVPEIVPVPELIDSPAGSPVAE